MRDFPVHELATTKNKFFNHSEDLMILLRQQMIVLIECMRTTSTDCIRSTRPSMTTTSRGSRSRSLKKKNIPIKPKPSMSDHKSIPVISNASGCSLKTRSKSNYRKKTAVLYPPIGSVKIEPNDIDINVRKKFCEFIKKSMVPFDQFFDPIIPLTNSCRMNYQSQQAIRVFYGKQDVIKSTPGYAVRSVYGPEQVMYSTGHHPANGYKVRPFTEEIEELSDLVLASVRKNDSTIDETLKYNFMEIKIYLGNDMLCDNGITLKNCDNENLRMGCNKRVNAHNDLCYSDDGVQSKRDTACPELPTATFTVGSSRQLTFERMFKKLRNHSWSTYDSKHWVQYELDDGSIFVLVAMDDKPIKFEGINSGYYKTKHQVQFDNPGISFGFVFRLVRTQSTFDPQTNCWIYWMENSVLRETVWEFIKKHAQQYKEVNDKDTKIEMEVILRNIHQFIANF